MYLRFPVCWWSQLSLPRVQSCVGAPWIAKLVALSLLRCVCKRAHTTLSHSWRFAGFRRLFLRVSSGHTRPLPPPYAAPGLSNSTTTGPGARVDDTNFSAHSPRLSGNSIRCFLPTSSSHFQPVWPEGGLRPSRKGLIV